MTERDIIAAAIGFALLAGVAWAADPVAPPAPAPGQPAAAKAADEQAAATTPAENAKPPFSVMFSAEDMKAINQAFGDHARPSAREASPQAQAAQVLSAVVEAKRSRGPNIYVSAVLDFGGGNWTVWANGLRVTPDQQPPLFRVLSVHGDTVEIAVAGESETRIVLQPYQTWRSSQRDVVEGIVP